MGRGMGKVFYQTVEMAQHAINTLHRTELNGRPLIVQALGDETRKKRKTTDDSKPPIDQSEIPKLLPLSYFDGHDTDEQKMELCYAAFEDLLENHDPEATGKGHVWMIRVLVREINQVFEGNDEAKQAFAWRLGKHPWFRENSQMVKWQRSRSLIQISKVDGEKGKYGKGEGKDKGKDRSEPPPMAQTDPLGAYIALQAQQQAWQQAYAQQVRTAW